MSDTTPHLTLPFLSSNQAQKHVTLNDALGMLDTLVQLVIQDVALASPPPTPHPGDTYALPSGCDGDWEGQDGSLAVFEDGAWRFHTPQRGWRAMLRPTAEALYHDGDRWRVETAVMADSVAHLGVNTQADDANRFAVRSDSLLLTALAPMDGGSGDARLVVNREDAANVASLVFQSAYVGAAELGLTGPDLFAVKVSGDGSAFTSALEVDTTTGHLGIGTNPSGVYPLSLRKDQNAPTQMLISNLSEDDGARAGLRLNTSSDHYFTIQLFSSGEMYAFTSGEIVFGTYAEEDMRLRTNAQDRVRIHSDGRVSIGTSMASALLAVNGSVRIGQTDMANLPEAAGEGAGAILLLQPLSGHARLVFSDGEVWRYVSGETEV